MIDIIKEKIINGNEKKSENDKLKIDEVNDEKIRHEQFVKKLRGESNFVIVNSKENQSEIEKEIER